MAIQKFRSGDEAWVMIKTPGKVGPTLCSLTPVTITAVPGRRITGKGASGTPISADIKDVYRTPAEARSTLPGLVPVFDLCIGDFDDEFAAFERLYSGGKITPADARRVWGERLVEDDDQVRAELQDRGHWGQFLSARDQRPGGKPRNWLLATRREVFVGFDGFTNPADNGFVWYRQLDRRMRRAVIRAFHRNSVVPE